MEGSATKQVLMKFRWFLKVKSMLQLNLDFNTVPTDKQTVVCEKYGLWSVVEKLAGTTRRRRQSCTSDRGKTLMGCVYAETQPIVAYAVTRACSA
jgi:hypothetical protein